MKRLLSLVKDRRQIRLLPDASFLEEAETPRMALRIITAIFSLLIIALLWAGFAKVEEVAPTYGQVIPSGNISIIQHLEGGIVAKVLVSEGEHVQAGQILVVLDPTTTQTNLKQMRSRELTLALGANRLQQLANKKSLANLPQEALSLFDSKYQEDIKKFFQDGQHLLAMQNASHQDQRAILTAQVLQRQAEQQQLQDQINTQKDYIQLLDEELEMYEALKDRDIVSKKELLRVKRDMAKARAELLKHKNSLNRAEKSLQEAQLRLKELDTTAHATSLEDMSHLNAELLEVKSTVARLEDQYNRSQIRAPISGYVKGLSISSGRVISPGEALMEIVPSEQEMIVETRISTRDIGHVAIGDAVKIKVTTYDFPRYGSISGKITAISAATFLDHDKTPYYKGMIKLEKQFLQVDDKKYYLLAGMTVEAGVNTGKKSILQYLLKPIHSAVSNSFRER